MASESLPKSSVSPRQLKEGNTEIQTSRQELSNTEIKDQAHAHIGNNINSGPVSVIHYHGSTHPPEANDENTRWKRVSRLFAFDQMYNRLAAISAPHAKTCRWLFETKEYKRWRDPRHISTHHGFFWLKGKPGAGKSTLMKSALAHAQKTLPGSAIISFFFNSRGSPLEKSTEGMYRSLLLQLLEQVPRLQTVLEGRNLPSDLTDRWRPELLKEVFREAVTQLGQDSMTCYIDALDECLDDEVRDLVEFFEDLGESTVCDEIQFHVCFSSRHYPHVSIRYSIELGIDDKEEHQKDIADYIHSKLKVRGPMLRELEATMIGKAAGVFLWVILVVRILNLDSDRGDTHLLRTRLLAIPDKLSELFREIIDRGTKDDEFLVLTLQWILYAERPLACDELYYAVLSALDPEAAAQVRDSDEITALDMERFIVDKSKGLAELTEGQPRTVQFIHESVIDHFRDTHLGALDPRLEKNVVGLSHNRLKQFCQDYIMAFATEHLSLPGKLSEVQSYDIHALHKVASARFPFLEYACLHVLHHADIAQEHGVDQITFLNDFPITTWALIANVFEPCSSRRYTDRVTMIYILVERQYSHLVGVGVEQLPGLQQGGEYYGTPLGAAAALNYVHGIEKLLTKGADINSSGSRSVGDPCIWRAMENDCTDAIRLLAKHGADLEQKCKEGETLLSTATRWEDEETVRLLLELGANVNAQGGYHGSALQEASWGGSTGLVRLLINSGANVNAHGGVCGNALQAASRQGSTELVQLLLDSGAYVNAQGGECGNALHAALWGGSAAVVGLLLDRGAKVDARGPFGGPFHTAARSWHETAKKVETLLLRGASIDVKGEEGDTALVVASWNGATEVVRLLLDRGANVNAHVKPFGSAFQAAKERGHQKTMQLLIARGADGADGGRWHDFLQTPLVSALAAGTTIVAYGMMRRGLGIK